MGPESLKCPMITRVSWCHVFVRLSLVCPIVTRLSDGRVFVVREPSGDTCLLHEAEVFHSRPDMGPF